ncbi:MAG: nicotinate phosphoribosyltransferase [Thermoproteota archaeon]
MGKLVSDFINTGNMGMLTDLYELAMCASYLHNDKTGPATFDLFIRKLPPNRSYFLFAGLEQVLLYLDNIEFQKSHLEYLREQGFREEFLDYLRDFDFTGDVWAAPEGTVIFPNEPLIRVTGPIMEAQLVETFLLNAVNIQTMIATKASRVAQAAEGRSVVDFSLRRTHGTDAGMKVARASYIAGCSGTSNVLAGMKYGIPIFGTMAHAFVESFQREIDSFRAFARTFPEGTTLLIDTYDDLEATEKAAQVAKELEKDGYKMNGVRLDSGDLLTLSQKVRKKLDEEGLTYVKIFASGGLNEYKIKDLIEKGAQIDAFGVGTSMGTSDDYPSVDVVYKIAEKTMDGKFVPTMKLSENKMTLPGRKKIYRIKKNGKYHKDVITLDDEEWDGEPLLVKAMEKGEVVCNPPALEEIRERALENLSLLPEKYKKFKDAPEYPVILSPKLKKTVERVKSKLKETQIG